MIIIHCSIENNQSIGVQFLEKIGGGVIIVIIKIAYNFTIMLKWVAICYFSHPVV